MSNQTTPTSGKKCKHDNIVGDCPYHTSETMKRSAPASGKDKQKLRIAQDLMALPIGTNKPLQWDMDVLVDYIADSNQQTVQKALATNAIKTSRGSARKAYIRTASQIRNNPAMTVPQIVAWLDRQVERLATLAATQPHKDERNAA